MGIENKGERMAGEMGAERMNDDLDTARGILIGVCIGALFWIAAAAIAWWL